MFICDAWIAKRQSLPEDVELYVYPVCNHVKKKAGLPMYPRTRKNNVKKYLTTSKQSFSRNMTHVGILIRQKFRAINGDINTCAKLFLIPIS